MPNRITQEKAQAIAEQYCTNGLNKAKALLDVGYKESYARSGIGLKVYDNILVKEAISQRSAELQAENIATRKLRQQFWTGTMNDTMANMGDRLRASELLGKSEADFTEVIHQTGDAQRELDAKERAEARRISLILLNKPKGAKDAI